MRLPLIVGWSFVLTLAAWACLSAAASAGQRVALVVGNSDYANAPSLSNPKNDAALMRDTLAEAGFDVTLETMEQTQHIATGLSGNYQANLWRQFSSPDPDGEFHWWISTAIAGEGSTGLNFARLDDPQVDEALRTGRTNLDPVERKKAYADLQRRMSEIVPWVYLSHLQWMLAADLDVRDLTNTTLPDGTPAMPMVAGVHRMTQTWLES